MEIGNIKISRLKETNDDEAEAEAHAIAKHKAYRSNHI